MAKAKRRMSATVTAADAAIDRAETVALKDAQARADAGDVLALADAIFAALGAHEWRRVSTPSTTARATPETLMGLAPVEDARVVVPVWVLSGCLTLIGIVVTKAPGLVGRRGRHAAPARADADHLIDSWRWHMVEAGLRAGVELPEAKRRASARLSGTAAAGKPEVMGQAWQRVQQDPARTAFSFSQGFFFRHSPPHRK